jgi:hypothetical protein
MCNARSHISGEKYEWWPDHVARPYGAFLSENKPDFNAYDYGANIEIIVSERLQSMGRET